MNEKLCEGIYQLMKIEPNSKPDGWACDLYTTIMSSKNILTTPPFDSLTDIIFDEVVKYARKLKLDIDNYPPRINECWVNVYGKGHAQDVHHHKNSVISGIYYPKAPDGCGVVMFHSPLADYMLEPPITEKDPVNLSIFPLRPISGRMVLFRSWLKHSVQVSTINEDRISIAFNVTM